MSAWRYTTNHARSSYGQAVLVAPDGRAYGPEDLLTTAQAGEVLGVNASRVRQLVLAGRLPAEKAGRDLLIRVRDLERIKSRKNGRPRKAVAPRTE